MFPEAHVQAAYQIVSLIFYLGEEGRPTGANSIVVTVSCQNILPPMLGMRNPPVLADAEIHFERHR